MDDFRSGIQQTSGGIELNDEAFVVLGSRGIHRPGNVTGCGRADGTVNFDQTDLRGVKCHAEEQPKNRDEAKAFHIDAST